MKQLIGVGVLLVADNKLLLGKRLGSHGAGTWALPGGHLDIGESPESCAIREVSEETGLLVSSTQHVGFTNDVFVAEDKQYITLFVKALAFSGLPQVLEPEKCEQWRWFAQEEFPDNLFKPFQTLLEQGYEVSEL